MTTDNLRTGGRAYFDKQKVEAAIYAYLDKRARKPEAPDSLGDDRKSGPDLDPEAEPIIRDTAFFRLQAAIP